MHRKTRNGGGAMISFVGSKGKRLLVQLDASGNRPRDRLGGSFSGAVLRARASVIRPHVACKV